MDSSSKAGLKGRRGTSFARNDTNIISGLSNDGTLPDVHKQIIRVSPRKNSNDYFGQGLAYNGGVLAIGAPQKTDSDGNTYAGVLYLYS